MQTKPTTTRVRCVLIIFFPAMIISRSVGWRSNPDYLCFQSILLLRGQKIAINLAGMQPVLMGVFGRRLLRTLQIYSKMAVPGGRYPKKRHFLSQSSFRKMTRHGHVLHLFIKRRKASRLTRPIPISAMTPGSGASVTLNELKSDVDVFPE